MTGGFPSQRPVTRKMFPFDDVIMKKLPWLTSLMHEQKTNTKIETQLVTIVGCAAMLKVKRKENPEKHKW